MGREGSSPLPFFEIRKKMSWFWKKVILNLEKSVLFVCIYGLNCLLKSSFKRIFEKQKTKCFPTETFFCMWFMKRLSKYPYSKKPPEISWSRTQKLYISPAYTRNHFQSNNSKRFLTFTIQIYRLTAKNTTWSLALIMFRFLVILLNIKLSESFYMLFLYHFISLFHVCFQRKFHIFKGEHYLN